MTKEQLQAQREVRKIQKKMTDLLFKYFSYREKEEDVDLRNVEFRKLNVEWIKFCKLKFKFTSPNDKIFKKKVEQIIKNNLLENSSIISELKKEFEEQIKSLEI